MNISALLADKPWIALIVVAVVYVIAFVYSLYKGKYN